MCAGRGGGCRLRFYKRETGLATKKTPDAAVDRDKVKQGGESRKNKGSCAQCHETIKGEVTGDTQAWMGNRI